MGPASPYLFPFPYRGRATFHRRVREEAKAPKKFQKIVLFVTPPCHLWLSLLVVTLTPPMALWHNGIMMIFPIEVLPVGSPGSRVVRPQRCTWADTTQNRPKQPKTAQLRTYRKGLIPLSRAGKRAVTPFYRLMPVKVPFWAIRLMK